MNIFDKYRNHLSRVFCVFICGFTALSINAKESIQVSEKYVRLVYLVSRDKQLDDELVKRIRDAIIQVQSWYARQMDGYTFKVHPENVKIIKTDVDSSYFSSNPNGANRESWGVMNCASVANRFAGARFLDPSNIWVIFSDSRGWTGMGGGGFTCMPKPQEDMKSVDINRYAGGLAHELGHALGLTHPKDFIEQNKALMAYGWYADFPEPTYLSKDDMDILRQSPFMFKDELSILGAVTEYRYVPDGWFEKRNNGRWYEYKNKGNWFAIFEEVGADNSHRILYDSARRLYLKLPIRDGKVYISSDERKSWNFIFPGFLNKPK